MVVSVAVLLFAIRTCHSLKGDAKRPGEGVELRLEHSRHLPAVGMSWRNLAYGSQQAAEAAPAVVPTKAPVKETVVSQGTPPATKAEGWRRRERWLSD